MSGQGWWLALAAVSTSCRGAGEPPVGPADRAETASAARMHVRFEAAHRIEDAIARSDLDVARAQARELVDLPEPGALPRWRPFLIDLTSAVAEEPTILPSGAEQIGDEVSRVRLYANRALAAIDAEERAATFGAILTTCARCHAAIRDGGDPTFVWDSAPAAPLTAAGPAFTRDAPRAGAHGRRGPHRCKCA